MRTKTQLLSWALTAAGLFPFSVMAQIDPAAATASQPGEDLAAIAVTESSEKASAEKTERAANNSLIEEVVVTAQKREENSQSVPVAITAFTGDQLVALGVNNTKDLSLVTPGLQFTETAGFTLVYLRGIGTDAFVPYADPSVATYIDGLYIPAQQGLINSFGGIERVEVLKGPQGTLFGRNSTGGAINVITKSPGNDTEMSATQEYGNYQTVKTQLYGAFPIGETLAASLSVIYNHQNPLYQALHDSSCLTCTPSPDGVHDEESEGARLKLRWTPTDDLDLLVGGYAIHQTGSGTTIAALTHASDAATALGIQAESSDYTIHRNEPSLLEVQNTAVYGNFKWALPWFDLKTILGSQLIVTQNAYYDYDGSEKALVAFDTHNEHSRVNTAELQILSNDGSWRSDQFKWIGGVYYLQSEAGFDPLGLHVAGGAIPLLGNIKIPGVDLTLPSVDLDIFGMLRTHSLSGFAQASYDFTDWFGATLGARVQKEDRFLDKQFVTLADADDKPGATVLSYNAPKVTQQNFSPKISLNFKPADDILTYLTASKGYKSGTYNGLNVYLPPNYVKPEEVRAYEIGLKSDFFEKTLRFNAAVFQSNIKNVQAVFVSLTNGGAITFENAASARSRGAEFDTIWLPLPDADPGLALTAGLSYIDAIYTSYPNASGYNETDGLFFSKTGDFTGNRLPRTPKTSGNFGLNQRLDINSGTIEIGGDLYYNSGFYFTSQNTSQAEQGAYELLNAHVSYLYQPWKVKITAFGQNLADKKYKYSSFTEDFGTFSNLAAPLTYGLRFNWDY